jgi:hypothetical protein
MHQQLWGYKVECKSVSRGTGGKKVEYHWCKRPSFTYKKKQVKLVDSEQNGTRRSLSLD